MEIRALQTNTGTDAQQVYQAAPTPLVANTPTSAHQSSKPSVQSALVKLSDQGLEKAQVSTAVDNLAVTLKSKIPNLAFALHEKDGRILVQISDQETKEVIKQIPSKEILELSERLDKIISELSSHESLRSTSLK